MDYISSSDNLWHIRNSEDSKSWIAQKVDIEILG